MEVWRPRSDEDKGTVSKDKWIGMGGRRNFSQKVPEPSMEMIMNSCRRYLLFSRGEDRSK